MPVRGTCLMPSTAAITAIYVDTLLESEPIGWICNPYLPSPQAFHGFDMIVNLLEDLFNQLNFPQSYFQCRTFNGQPHSIAKPNMEVHKLMPDIDPSTPQGEKATFIVHVQFRQNATWQGTISWTDKKKTQRFRSTFEMLKLMNDALEPQDKLPEWEE